MNEKGDFISDHLTESRFRFFIVLLRTAGIPMFDNIPKLFKVYSLIITLLVYMFCLFLFVDIFEHNDNLEHTMDTTRIASSSSLCVWIYTFLRFRSSQVMKLLHLTKPFSWETLPKTEEEARVFTMAQWIDVVKNVVRKVIICTIITLVIYAIVRPILSGEKQLLFNMWLPYNTSSSPGFELTVALQIFTSLMFMFSFMAFGGLHVTLICIVSNELQKLRVALLKITDVYDIYVESKVKTGQKETGNLHRSGGMHEKINKCVQHHQEILSFVGAVENVLNPIMAGFFLLGLINLCLCSFSIVTSLGDYLQMTIGLIGYSYTLITIAICCWFGNELTSEAENVRDAAWGCDWIGKPISEQQSISLIIAMANKELTLTAGKFVPVTIGTLVNMINQSLSYFMFLLEVKTSLEETETSTSG